jgi:hypothetical protein
MENIDKHIQKNKAILDDTQSCPQQRRHIEVELQSLQSYKVNHPDDDHDPTPLELFCNENPDASECRIYET